MQMSQKMYTLFTSFVDVTVTGGNYLNLLQDSVLLRIWQDPGEDHEFYFQ